MPRELPRKTLKLPSTDLPNLPIDSWVDACQGIVRVSIREGIRNAQTGDAIDNDAIREAILDTLNLIISDISVPPKASFDEGRFDPLAFHLPRRKLRELDDRS